MYRMVWMLASMPIAIIALYIAVTFAHIPPVYLLPVAVIAVAAMEYLLIRWSLGRTEPSGGERTHRIGTTNSGEFERKSRIAEFALKGKRYSQQVIFEELRSALVERVASRSGMSSRRLVEAVAEKGTAQFFGHAALADLYERKFANDANDAKRLTGTEFAEQVNRIFESLEQY
jgi:hypothetical protein